MASEPTANISRDCAALARREGHGHGHVQGVSKISSQKNATTTKNLPSPPDYIRTLANRPVGADNPGCCCTGLKTGWARTGCEHGSVKTKQAKPATHPLFAPVQTKNLPTRTQHLAPKPTIHPDKRPPTDVNAAGVCRRPAVCPGGGQGSDAEATRRSREGLIIVRLSLVLYL